MRLKPLFALATLAVTAVSCTDDTEPKAPSEFPEQNEIEIRYTEHGIPHVRALTWEDAAFGTAYAFSRDHICTLADQLTKVRGERALYFGRGEEDANVESDFAHLHLRFMEDAEREFPGLEPELQRLLDAYAQGVNRYVADVGLDGLPTPCRGGDWVQPLTGTDMLAYYLQLGGRGSSVALAAFVPSAQPPNSKGGVTSWAELGPSVAEEFAQNLPNLRTPGIGSNGWALGSDLTETGRGAVLSNTHFPSQGELQWWEMHVEVIGDDELPASNVYGASLMGVFPLNMGFNEHVAWTHTVSTSPRLIGYRLDLDPQDPTRYNYDGDWREMSSHEYTIAVLGDGGELSEEGRTLWRTHYGPMIDIPPIGWSAGLGISYRDANDVNLRMLPQWLEMNRATSMDDFVSTFSDIGGIPWVHTIAADAEGEVFYIDAGSLPNLSPEATDAYLASLDSDPIVQGASNLGFVLVDGGDSLFEWVDVDQTRPGLVPASEAPTLRRRDFVANSNDSHWATNPRSLIEGVHPLFGAERESFSLPRTRMGLIMLMEGEPTHRGEDGLWSVAEILEAATSGRAAIADVLLDEVRERCRSFGDSYELEFGGAAATVNPQTEICDVLDSWDGRLAVDSVGAVLWRQAIAGQAYADEQFLDSGVVFRVGFDPERPWTTPSGLLDTPDANTRLLDAFAGAVLTLESVGISPDERLGDVQFQRMLTNDFERVGGLEREGAFAIADWRGSGTLLDVPTRAPVVDDRSGLTEEGWPVNAGNSWVMAMEYTDEGPRGQALMTYGQSEDPESEHYDDQAERYSTLEWREIVYDWEELREIEPIVLTR